MLQRKNKWCGSVTGASKRAISFLPALTMWRSVSLTALAFALPRDENSNCDRFEMARLNLINVRRHSDNRFCKVPIELDVTIYESITLTITIEPVPPQSPRGYHNNIHIQRLDKKTGRHRREQRGILSLALQLFETKLNGLSAHCTVCFYNLLMRSGAQKFLHAAARHLFAICTFSLLSSNYTIAPQSTVKKREAVSPNIFHCFLGAFCVHTLKLMFNQLWGQCTVIYSLPGDGGD